MKIWLDGKLIDEKKVQVSVTSHALHYGTCAFEGIRFYETANGPAIFRLLEHLKRLRYSAKQLSMKKVPSAKELREAIIKTIKANKLSSGYVRPIIFYGEGGLGLPTKKNAVHVAIITLPWKDYLDKSGISLASVERRRIDGRTFCPDAKLGGTYVNSLLALNEAHAKGADEVLMLDLNGYVAEGSAENVFFMKNGKIRTPAEGSILPGITRETVITLAQDLGYDVKEKRCALKEFKEADEVFMVGTAAEVTPVTKIDKKKVSTGEVGEITRQLDDLYTAVVTGNDEGQYKKWRTSVT